MYFLDWLFHRAFTSKDDDIFDFKEALSGFEDEVRKLLESPGNEVDRVVSETPSDARSIYRITDDYIDVRTFFDEWRGGGVVGLLGPFLVVLFMFFL